MTKVVRLVRGERPDGQFRIDRVQVLNWGGYNGLQLMLAGRSSTALLGPSGRGKSTLLDAMASVIMPNPQEFNQAARDDRGSKRERTMYSYARGLTVSQQDQGSRATTPNYLRGAERGGFACGAAITWATESGKRVTALRVAWISPQATDNEAIANATVYGFIYDDFDLARLNGLRPARGGASPISPATMQPLVDAGRGDVVSSRQASVHAALRSAMRMGHSDESQRLAMNLLRLAQASKGIYSINELFRGLLTEPEAMRRWEVTLQHYQEAARLFDEFEMAQKKAEILEGLPDAVEQYKAAGADAVAKRAVVRQPDDGVSRLGVWHAHKVAAWSAAQQEDLKVERALQIEQMQAATSELAVAKAARARALDDLTSGGGDLKSLARERLSHAESMEQAVLGRRQAMGRRLGQFDAAVPDSAGDLTLTRAVLEQQSKHLGRELAPLRDAYESAVSSRGQLVSAITTANNELAEITQRGGNIPQDADQRRNYIAAGVQIAAERLRYVGELLEIPPAFRGWERAILRIIRPLASDLMIPEPDLPAVRAFVNSHDMGGDLTLAPAKANQPVVEHPQGTVAAMLSVTPGPYSGWISSQLSRFTYLCVEDDTKLGGPNPAGTVGRVTRAGMRTAPNGRLVKNDRVQRYRWIGQDNSDLLAQLRDNVEGLERSLPEVHSRAQSARVAVEGHQNQQKELRRLLEDLSWPELDAGPIRQQLAELKAELAAAESPEQEAKKRRFDRADTQQSDAQRKVDRLGAC